ncbi:MAG: hypothetical protein ABIJ61_14210 [bacterium]
MLESASIDERIAKCEKILKSNASSQAFAPLADALRMKGELDQAFRICRQGLRRHPEYGAGHLVMAKINLDRKMYDWAEQELEEAVRLEGESRASEQLRVEILLAKGDYGQAQKLLAKLKLIGGNPLYLQSIEDRIKRARQRSARSGEPGATDGAELDEGDGDQAEAKLPPPPYTLSRALDELVQISGVTLVLCTHRDGVLVDHRGESELKPEATAALCLEMFRVTENEGGRRYLGAPLRMSVDASDGTIEVVKQENYHFIIFIGEEANLGALRLKLEEIADRLEPETQAIEA